MLASLPNIHPFMVHFPVALCTLALVCDVVFWLGFRRAWFDRSTVVLYVSAALGSGGAAISGKLAANQFNASIGALGTSDGFGSDAPSRLGEDGVVEAVAVHGDWAFFAVVLLFVVAALRFDALFRDRLEAAPTVHRTRVIALAVALLTQWVLVQTAGRGGELVYQYGVGVQQRAIIPQRR
jgi:uncharacterized membrane protein